MNKYLTSIFVFVLASSSMAYSQFSVGAISFNILSDTPVLIDSMAITPSADQEINNNVLNISYTPVNGTPNGSVTRVYQWDTPFSFVGGVLGLYFADDELNGNDPDDLQLAFSPDMNNDNFVVLSGGSSGGNFVSESGLAADLWQQMTAARIGSVLPLKLLSFTASIASDKVNVAWRVAQESGVEKYVVTRSSDGNTFYSIGSVAAACNGCQTDFNYSFADDSPNDGFNFYRLNIVEAEGRIQYSDVVRVNFDRDLNIVVSPNPAQTEINLLGLSVDKQYQLSIYSAAGQQIYKQSGVQNTNKLKVNVVGWTNGMYFIHLSDNENNSYRLKVVKK